MKKIAAIGLTVAMMTAASAEDASAQTVFDGGYYGVGLGYGRADTSGGTGIMPDSKGFFASGIIGWNGSSGNLVYGVEADASLAKIDGSDPCANPAWTCEADMRALGSLRGRIGGVSGSGNTLFFATAGLAAARMELTTDNNAGSRFPDTQTISGWVAGVGVEQHMPSGWNVRGEILHYRFNDEDYALDVPYLMMETKMTGVRLSMTTRF
jgi:outer membrane immunogenic protein